MRSLERLSNETGRDYAFRVLKENIISLELAPGSQISENEIAAELGLSRTPVREALQELAKVKVIAITPQKKSVVMLIDYDLVEESRFMRHLLECAVVRLDCEIAKPEDIARLQENTRLQTFYLENFVPEQLWALDDQFHSMLFGIARKSAVYDLTKSISIHDDRIRNMSLHSVKDLKIVRDHANIAEAIASGNADKAEELMKVHLNRYKIDAVKIREKYPKYFK